MSFIRLHELFDAVRRRCPDRLVIDSGGTQALRHVCSKILTHLKLPLRLEELSDGAFVYDVTVEPVFDADEAIQDAPLRGPPTNWDGIESPTPAE